MISQRSLSIQASFAIAMGILGAVLNHLAVPPLPCLPLYMGGVAYLSVLLMLGWRWGLLVAAITALGLLGKGIMWLPLLETSVIALLMGRWQLRPWLASLVFWLVLGMPFMAGAGRSVAGVDWPILGSGMLAAGLNGLFNILLAELLVGAMRAADTQSLADQLMHRLVLFAVIPTLGLSMYFNYSEVRTSLSQRVQRLDHGLGLARERLDEHVADVTRHLERVAVRAGTLSGAGDASAMGGLLDDTFFVQPGLLTLIIADSHGIIRAGYPSQLPDGRGAGAAGMSIADRDYFKAVQATGRPYVSDVFRGRGFGNDPIIAVAVPMPLADGQRGVVEASLALSGLTTLVKGVSSLEHGVSSLILDRQGRTVYADAGLGLGFLAPPPPALASILRQPQLKPDGFKDSDARPYLFGAEFVRHKQANATRWQIVQLYDLRSDIVQFTLRTVLRLVVALLLLLVARVLAGRFAERLLAPLAQLNRVTESLNLLDIGRILPVVVERAPREVTDLLRTFNAMVARLAKSQLEIMNGQAEREQLNRQLEQHNLELEHKVHERTEELRQKAVLLEQLSITDALTGLYNRRHVMRELGREWRRAKRFGTVFSVLMLDIDHFKCINDGYGHPAGDAVLRTQADFLRTTLRETDVVARLGGEEFVIILPGTDHATAEPFAERIRAGIAEQCCEFQGQVLRWTVSIGVVDSRAPELVDEQGMIALADKALYQAKHSGRNRVCSLPQAT